VLIIRRMSEIPQETAPRQPEKPRRWIGPALLAVILVTPFVILVLSNTETTTVSWAGFDWDAPLWLVLAATFLAGAIGGKLFGWAWRRWRRRRRRLADERDVLRRHAQDDSED
jgi:uncharacterized integral membrane protein